MSYYFKNWIHKWFYILKFWYKTTGKLKFLFAGCIQAELMVFSISEIFRVMSCQNNLCNSPASVLPKLSKSILCTDGYYI